MGICGTVNNKKCKLGLIFIILITFLSYSCTVTWPLRGKEKDLIIQKLEKYHGINPSDVYIVAKYYYAKTQHQEISTMEVPDTYLGTYKVVPRTTPCIQLTTKRNLINDGILVITDNELLVFDISDKGFQNPIYNISFNNINSIALVYSNSVYTTDPFQEVIHLQVIFDEKKSISLTTVVLPHRSHEIFNYLSNKNIKLFNSCGLTQKI